MIRVCALLGIVVCLGLAGCSSSSSRASAPTVATTRSPSLPRRAVARCKINELAFDYYGGAAGAGSDVGTIRIRDIAPQPCELRGPAAVSGTDTKGKAVTQTASYGVAGLIVLTARAALLPNMQPPPAGEVVADLLMSASYRDDGSSPDGLCTAHRIVPASWRLTFAGGTRTVANVSHNPDPQWPSLVSCKGEINTPRKIGSSANGA